MFNRNGWNCTGYRFSCRACDNKKKSEWRKKNKGRYRQQNYESQLRARARIGRGFKGPDRDCEICGVRGKLFYDHCHSTNKFRGWLCLTCNSGLGMAKDDVGILKKMIEYLERSRVVQRDPEIIMDIPRKRQIATPERIREKTREHRKRYDEKCRTGAKRPQYLEDRRRYYREFMERPGNREKRAAYMKEWKQKQRQLKAGFFTSRGNLD